MKNCTEICKLWICKNTWTPFFYDFYFADIFICYIKILFKLYEKKKIKCAINIIFYKKSFKHMIVYMI